MSARLALANFSDEQIRLRIQEKRENKEKLRLAKEHLADLQCLPEEEHRSFYTGGDRLVAVEMRIRRAICLPIV